MPQKTFRQLLFLSLLALGGCFGGGHYAPVVERQARVSVTLYSIAWRYNLDFRGLASTNNITAPYTIYPGQVIRLKARSGAKTTAARQTSRKPDNARVKRRKQTANSAAATGAKTSAARPLSIDKNRYPFRWKWPARGRMSRSYSSSSAVHKGIDIQGKLGESVYAANSGKVVYAGSGLVGYGKLLIIKHDEHYLSAYGHNRRLMVDEGELVKVGQKIAEFGDTGTDKVKLHFEIRRDGKPVNPLDLLPGR